MITKLVWDNTIEKDGNHVRFSSGFRFYNSRFFLTGTVLYLNENGFLDNIDDLPAIIHSNREWMQWFKDGYVYREDDKPTTICEHYDRWEDREGRAHRNS